MGSTPRQPLGYDVFRTYNFDSPDGQNCLRKVAHSSKLGAMSGFYLSLYDVVGISKPKGFMAVAGRMCSFGIPGAGIGAVYATTSCVLGDIRGENGAINHAIGGLAAGSVMGLRLKNVKVGMAYSLLFAAVGALIKQSKDAGVMLWVKEVKPAEGFQNGPFYSKSKRYAEPTQY